MPKGDDEKFLVIGAGLPRTGTTSLQAALQMLLNGQCYHMRMMVYSKGLEQVRFWNKALKSEVNEEVIYQWTF